MKKLSLFLTITLTLFLTSTVYSQNSGSDIAPPDNNETFKLTLDLEITSNNEVILHWNSYTGENFKYYKLLRNDFPGAEYPEDGYLWYGTDASVSSYTDKDLKQGTLYYRICVVKNDGNKIYSESIPLNLEDDITICAKVITYGLDPDTNKWIEFPTPCDVPDGWKTSNTKPNDDEETNITKEEFERALKEAYDKGYKDGYHEGMEYGSEQNCPDHPENNDCDIEACQEATLSPTLALHIPLISYETLIGNIPFSADFQYIPTDNDMIIFQLVNVEQISE